MGRAITKKIERQDGIDNKFRKVDLHVHTPASKCYRGDKGDDEYLKIIKKAKHEKLEVIAITDHNSISGYRKLLEIKQNLISEKRNIEVISDSRQASVRLREIEKQLSLFDGILILPGVEFEVKNGIHLLVIFNDITPLETIEAFLHDGGYDDESYGYEDATIIANWDIFELYDESKRFDCIIIDPHTDSNKGIYNTIPKGNIRANCFKSEQLVGVCYCSEKQKDQLENIIRTSKEYKRNTPLSFLRFSDAHEISKIGQCFTWFDINKLTFNDLKLAFLNPTEKISVEAPEVEKILNKLINEELTFTIADLSSDNLKYFQQIVCALNNSMGGTVLFGVTEQKNKIGISRDGDKSDQESIRTIYDLINSRLATIDGHISCAVNIYKLQNNRLILSIKVIKSDNLVSIKDEGHIYAVKKGELKVLAAKEAQSIIEGQNTQQIEERLQRRIARIEKDCLLIKNLFRAVPIIKKFEAASVELSRVAGVSEIAESLDFDRSHLGNIKKAFRDSSNGKSRGNIFLFESLQVPRLKHAYLRYSLPIWYVKAKGILTTSPQQRIYIVPGGAVYHSKKDISFYSSKYPLILKLSSLNKDYSERFIVAFLKSSFWLWYCQNKFESMDIFLPELFQQVLLPDIRLNIRQQKEAISKIEVAFDKIIDAEKTFLKQKLTATNAEEAVHSHNRMIDGLSYYMDELIYRLLNLTETEVTTIESGLRAIGLYLPMPEKTTKDHQIATSLMIT